MQFSYKIFYIYIKNEDRTLFESLYLLQMHAGKLFEMRIWPQNQMKNKN